MSKIKIYIKLVNGVLEYRDTEQHEGKTIETSVDPGDKIVWKQDDNSGIDAITGITVSNPEFFSKGPKQKDDKWVAVVAESASGEISYTVEYDAKEIVAAKAMTRGSAVDEDNPKIKIKL